MTTKSDFNPVKEASKSLQWSKLIFHVLTYLFAEISDKLGVIQEPKKYF